MIEDLLCGFVKEDWVEKLNFSTLEKGEHSQKVGDISNEHVLLF